MEKALTFGGSNSPSIYGLMTSFLKEYMEIETGMDTQLNTRFWTIYAVWVQRETMSCIVNFTSTETGLKDWGLCLPDLRILEKYLPLVPRGNFWNYITTLKDGCGTCQRRRGRGYKHSYVIIGIKRGNPGGQDDPAMDPDR